MVRQLFDDVFLLQGQYITRVSDASSWPGLNSPVSADPVRRLVIVGSGLRNGDHMAEFTGSEHRLSYRPRHLTSRCSTISTWAMRSGKTGLDVQVLARIPIAA